MPQNIEDISDRPIPQRLIDDLRQPPLVKTGQGDSGLEFDGDEGNDSHVISLLLGGTVGFVVGMAVSAFVR